MWPKGAFWSSMCMPVAPLPDGGSIWYESFAADWVVFHVHLPWQLVIDNMLLVLVYMLIDSLQLERAIAPERVITELISSSQCKNAVMAVVFSTR